MKKLAIVLAIVVCVLAGILIITLNASAHSASVSVAVTELTCVSNFGGESLCYNPSTCDYVADTKMLVCGLK